MDRDTQHTEVDEPLPPDALARPTKNVEKTRVCMSCRESFLSEGWHNRLCHKCRKRSETAGW
jgi:hypothetical protein